MATTQKPTAVLDPTDSFEAHVADTLATYKAKQPTPMEALLAAHQLLQTLDPATTNDPETLGLWGAVHKRLWDLDRQPRYLDEAVGAYSRGFYLRQDHYNGVNYAYLLELRALQSARAGAFEDAIELRLLRRGLLNAGLDLAEYGYAADIGCKVRFEPR